MVDFSVKDMLAMQSALLGRYNPFDESAPMETGKDKLLWMIGEVGSVIAIIKKYGESRAVTENVYRVKLLEEMADVLMCYADVMLYYGITAEELKEAYTDKFERIVTGRVMN